MIACMYVCLYDCCAVYKQDYVIKIHFFFPICLFVFSFFSLYVSFYLVIDAILCCCCCCSPMVVLKLLSCCHVGWLVLFSVT